mgnify:CR=1 FL=1
MGNKHLQEMGAGVIASQICALLGLVTLVIYGIYGLVYDYFDLVVFLTFTLGIVCAQGYVLVERSQFLNLVSVGCYAFGVGLFFLNSYPVWADRLNNITMYGSRGTLFPVILIIVLAFICILVEIVSCFLTKRKVASK